MTPERSELVISAVDDLSKMVSISVASTKACNWQLGSRVHWYDEKTLMFNDIDKNGKQISTIQDVKSRKILARFDLPFWQTSIDKSLAASLNFQRLKHKRPGYGYNGINKYADQEYLEIFKCQDGKSVLKLTIADLISNSGLDFINHSDLYLNHVSWCPCNTKLVTLLHSENPIEKVRMVYPFLIDIQSQKITLLNDSGFFSHHIWLDQNTFLHF